jgi:ribosomal protein S14
MAVEAIGIAASVLAVMNGLHSLGTGLWKVANRIGDSGREINHLANELMRSRSVFEQVLHVLQGSENPLGKDDNLVRDALTQCRQIMRPLANALGTMTRYTTEGRPRSVLRDFGLLLRFQFRHKKRFIFLRKRANGLHKTLKTTLMLIQIQAASNIRLTLDRHG